MPRLSRAVSLLLLLLHVLVGGLLPLADARAESGALAAEGTVHVEAQGSERCPPGHDELTCQLCPLLRLAGSPGGRVALPEVARVLSATVPVQPSSGPARGRIAPDQARAPPRG